MDNIKTIPGYTSWRAMKARCYNKKHRLYKRYGGRGLTVCDRWLNSSKAFLSDMGPRPERHTLERLNNELGYFCGSADCQTCGPVGYLKNCAWRTYTENNRNRCSSDMITFDGKTLCLAAWAELLRTTQVCLWRRVYGLKWPIDKALTTPIKRYCRRKVG